MKIRPEHEKKAVKVLSGVAPFSALASQRLEQLVRSDAVLLKEFSAGQQIFPCRSVSDCVGVLLSGESRTLSDGKIVSVGHEGVFFSEELLRCQKGDTVRIQAARVCRVFFVLNSAINELIEESAEFSSSCKSVISQAVSAQRSDKNQIPADKVLGDFAEYLLSRPHNAKGEVALPQDMFRLAKQLGFDKSSFFKAVETLNSCGAIALSGSSIRIVDEEKLRSFI